MTDIETFRQETRAWLEANCPASMRTPMPESETVWGGRNASFKNPDSKAWLEAMASKALVIAHNNDFNKGILKENSYYFSNSKEVKNILNTIKKNDNLQLVQNNFDAIVNEFNWEKRNGKGADVYGINLEAKYAPGQYWQMQGGATFQKSVFDEAVQWSDNIENTNTMENIKMTPEMASKCMEGIMENNELAGCMYETLVYEGFLPETLDEGDEFLNLIPCSSIDAQFG
jgi:hypothetical protein